MLTLYQQGIKLYTGCTDAQAPAVEEFMRTTYGTLDQLTHGEFVRAARCALRDIKDLEEIATDTDDPNHGEVVDLLAFSHHGDYQRAE